MRLVLAFLGCLALAALPRAVAAADLRDVSGLYDSQTLQEWGTRYRISTQKILDQVLTPILLSDERRALGQVRLVFPMPGEDRAANSAFGFQSRARAPDFADPQI